MSKIENLTSQAELPVWMEPLADQIVQSLRTDPRRRPLHTWLALDGQPDQRVDWVMFTALNLGFCLAPMTARWLSHKASESGFSNIARGSLAIVTAGMVIGSVLFGGIVWALNEGLSLWTVIRLLLHVHRCQFNFCDQARLELGGVVGRNSRVSLAPGGVFLLLLLFTFFAHVLIQRFQQVVVVLLRHGRIWSGWLSRRRRAPTRALGGRRRGEVGSVVGVLASG